MPHEENRSGNANAPSFLPEPLAAPAEPLWIGEAPRELTDEDRVGTLVGPRTDVHAAPAGVLDVRLDVGRAAPLDVRVRVLADGREPVSTLRSGTVLGIEGELRFDAVRLIQRVAIPDASPCVLVEWEMPDAAFAQDSRIAIELLVARTAEAEIVRVVQVEDGTPGSAGMPVSKGDDRAIGTASHDRSGVALIPAGDSTLCLLSHQAVRFTAQEGPEGALLTLTLPREAGRVRLAIAAIGASDDPAIAVSAARNAGARIRARTGTLRRRLQQCVALRSAGSRAERLFRSAILHLDSVPIHGNDRRTPAVLARAAILAGSFDIARELIDGMVGSDQRRIAALLYFAWSGDRRFLPPGNSDPDPYPGGATAETVPTADEALRAFGEPDPVSAASIARPVFALLQDVLGARPDAGRGRIRIRPVVPAGWTGFEVRNLPAGDARIRVAVSNEERALDLEIEQTEGAIPVRAILEPVFEARALAGATVDGQPAALTARPMGSRLQVPVQLTLDHARTVRLIGA